MATNTVLRAALVALFFAPSLYAQDFLITGYLHEEMIYQPCGWDGSTYTTSATEMLINYCSGTIGTRVTADTETLARVVAASRCGGTTTCLTQTNSYSFIIDNDGGVSPYDYITYNTVNFARLLPVLEPVADCSASAGTLSNVELALSIDQLVYSDITSTIYVVQGCTYSAVDPVIPKCYDTVDGPKCALTVVSDGGSSIEPNSIPADPVAEPLATSFSDNTVYDKTVTTEYGAPTDGCTPGEVSETCISTQTDYSVETLPDYLKWDPVSGTVQLTSSGSKTATITTTTETVTDNVTGEQVVTTTTVTNNYDSSVTTTTIGATGSTTTVGDPTSSITTETSVQSLDATGTVVSSSSSTTAAVEPPDTEFGNISDASGAPGDWSTFDSEVSSWSTPPDIIGTNKLPENLISQHFNGQAQCPAGLFNWSVFGISGTFAVCPYIGYAQDFLYWIFAILTTWSVYTTWATVFRST